VKALGILYSSVVKQKLHQDKMHKYFIDRLIEMGVTQSQLGHKVTDLDFDEAKYEYTLASIRQADIERARRVDIENNEHKWFRG
jgi:hypothetical protein